MPKGISRSKGGSSGVGGVGRGPFPRNGVGYTRNTGATLRSRINPALFHSDKWHTGGLQQFAHQREVCIRKRPVTGSVRIDKKSAVRSHLNQVAVRSKVPTNYHYRLASPVFKRTSNLNTAHARQAPAVADGHITHPQLPRRGWGGYAYSGAHTKLVSGDWYYTVNPLTSTSLDYSSHPVHNTNTAVLADDSLVRTGYWFNKKTKERSWKYPKQLIKKLHGSIPEHLCDIDTDSDVSDSDEPRRRRKKEVVVSKVNIAVDLGHHGSSYGKTARGILSYKKDPSGRNLKNYLNKKLNPHDFPEYHRWKC